MMVAAVQKRRGELLGGDEGRALIARAEEAARAKGVVRPDRIFTMTLPGPNADS